MNKPLQYHSPNRHATWLELFFDLVFVAAIGAVTHSLTHPHHGHFAQGDLIGFGISMLLVWWIWASHTLFANRYDTDSHPHRLSNLLIMFLMAMMSALCGSHIFSSFTWLLLYYGGIRLIQALLYLQAGRHHPESREFSLRMVLTILMGTGLSLSALWLPSPLKEGVFAGGIVLEMLLTAMASRRAVEFPVHLEHLVERVGLLSIIVLGESVISLVGGLQEVEWTPDDFLATAAGFLIIGLIWWIYFDSFNVLERAKRLKSGLPVLYANFAFCLGLDLIATAIRFGIKGGLVIEEFRWIAILGIMLFYVGKQVPYFVAIPVFRKNILINSGGCILITVATVFLDKASWVLMGIACAMAWYVFSNLRWTLAKDASAYLEKEELPG